MPFITANSLSLYYERAGAGDPLLFISGTGGDLRNKPNMFDRGLPQAFDLIAYDQRGLGQSEKPDRPYTMADYADDAARLLDALNIPRARVIGMSFGGMVAQELVLRHPEKVERLVLGCTSPGGAGGSSFKFHEIEDLKGEARTRHLMAINDTRRDAAWQAANADQVAAIIEQSNPKFEDEPSRAMGAHRQLEARRHHDTWERLPQIKIPVLVAGGKYDGIAPPEIVELLAKRIPGAELQWFEGGHLFTVQDRNATPAFIEFLKR